MYGYFDDNEIIYNTFNFNKLRMLKTRIIELKT